MRLIMKKFKILTVLLILCTVFISSAGVDEINISAQSRKQTFVQRYNKLLNKCKKKFKYDGSMYDMRKDASDEFKLWDKELNYVYKKIYSSLNKKEKANLKKLQLAWIKKKEKNAKEAAEDGGSYDSLVYMSELTKYTKKRIKWLINNYA